jgi:hypothetical protein
MHNVRKIKSKGNVSLHVKVYDFLFGPSSEVAKLFMRKLELDAKTYLKFLLSFFKSCRYKMPIAALQGSIDNVYLKWIRRITMQYGRRLLQCNAMREESHFGRS